MGNFFDCNLLRSHSSGQQNSIRAHSCSSFLFALPSDAIRLQFRTNENCFSRASIGNTWSRSFNRYELMRSITVICSMIKKLFGENRFVLNLFFEWFFEWFFFVFVAQFREAYIQCNGLWVSLLCNLFHSTHRNHKRNEWNILLSIWLMIAFRQAALGLRVCNFQDENWSVSQSTVLFFSSHFTFQFSMMNAYAIHFSTNSERRLHFDSSSPSTVCFFSSLFLQLRNNF